MWEVEGAIINSCEISVYSFRNIYESSFNFARSVKMSCCVISSFCEIIILALRLQEYCRCCIASLLCNHSTQVFICYWRQCWQCDWWCNCWLIVWTEYQLNWSSLPTCSSVSIESLNFDLYLNTFPIPTSASIVALEIGHWRWCASLAFNCSYLFLFGIFFFIFKLPRDWSYCSNDRFLFFVVFHQVVIWDSLIFLGCLRLICLDLNNLLQGYVL